jgi:hypothetical protein
MGRILFLPLACFELLSKLGAQANETLEEVGRLLGMRLMLALAPRSTCSTALSPCHDRAHQTVQQQIFLSQALIVALVVQILRAHLEMLILSVLEDGGCH